ncbi:MAG: hypothetical protein ACLPVO_02560 [Desulfomonilaceae bacterium]
MPEEIDDKRFFQSIPISVIFNWFVGETQIPTLMEPIQVTSLNLKDLVEKAISIYPSNLREEHFCIISRNSDLNGFTSREHFIPEGLGFSWTELPRGFGTCYRINNEFSNYEQEWLRYGLMGIFRPWFVGEGKDDSPEYYAPNWNNKTFSLVRLKNGNRIIVAQEGTFQTLTNENGSKQTIFKIEASQANATKVSLAIHKMVYLAFWLVLPEMIFHPGFDKLISFFKTPDERTYMPFWEFFLPAATPGVAFKFIVDMIQVSEKAQTDVPRWALGNIHAVVRAHHVIYGLTLMGTSPQMTSPFDKAYYRHWQPINDAPVRAPTEISWCSDNMEPVPLDECGPQIQELRERQLVS